jgi:hypothetical protein
VDRAREHVLARAALAEQEHRDVGIGGAPRGVEARAHRSARESSSGRVAERAAQLAVVAPQAATSSARSTSSPTSSSANGFTR